MSNEESKIHEERTARILTVACGLLFSAFSFIWLYVFQKDLLEAYHYALSEGKTLFSPVGTAVCCTAVLLVLRWLTNRLLHLKGAFRELAYFPSCLLLGVGTSIGYSVYEGDAIADEWAWLLPLLCVLFVGVAYVAGRFWEAYFGRSAQMGWVIIGNLFILLMLCFMTVSISNTQVHFHHELAVEAALRRHDYAAARRVGAKMVHPGRSLTALRGYAMSREKTMGEYLFQYPQPYGAEGLILDEASAIRFRLTADSLFGYWGARPNRGERAVDFFGRICREDVGSHVALDYHLSALLLERRLNEFVSEFDSLYTVTDSIIPRYYEEALFLHDKLHPSANAKVENAAMEEKWQGYDALRKELAGSVGEGNRIRREYGDTYWWYYQYK